MVDSLNFFGVSQCASLAFTAFFVPFVFENCKSQSEAFLQFELNVLEERCVHSF
jgi:hypothetical protein